MNETAENLITQNLNDHAHIVVLDDGDTFSEMNGSHVIMNAVLDYEYGFEFDLDESSRSYAITDLLKSHITLELLRSRQFGYSCDSKKYHRVLDRWNEFIFEIFTDWQDQMIESDKRCPPRNSPKFITYVDKNYNYEIFCDESDENKALIDITRSGM